MDKRGQYVSVSILGVCFMLMFTAFNSLQNMISSLYAQQGYKTLGQISLFCIYGAFGIANFFASYVIQRVSYRRLMFFCSIGYVLFQLTGLLVTVCQGKHDNVCSKGVIYSSVLFFSFVCGISASFIWVAQGSYVSEVSTSSTKVELFGLFWGLMMASQIIGNVFGTFVLGKVSNIVYFIVLCIIGLVGASMFMFVKATGKETRGKSDPLSLKQRLSEVRQLIFQPGSYSLKLYYCFTGMTVGCYAGFLFKLVNRSYRQSEGQSDQDFSKELKFHTGMVFIVLGVAQVMTSLIMNRIGDKFNRYRMASFGTVMVQVAAIVSLLTYFLESYWLCFICSALWGSAEAYLQSNTGGLISTQYQGKVAAFSVFRIFFAVGVCSSLLLNIIFTEAGVPDWVFIVVVLAYQSIVTVSTQQLEGRYKFNMKNSVLTQELNN